MVYNLALTKSILAGCQIPLQEKFGQNFLTEAETVNKIIETAQLKPTDVVVEVGAGIGALTQILAQKAKTVYAFEFDARFIPLLREHLKDYSSANLINQNILTFDPDDLSLKNLKYKVVGSIPYQITSPLIHRLLTRKILPSLIVLMVQREVAEKICAPSPNASYLSTFVASFAHASLIKIIKPKSFYPPPKVDSAIICLEIKPRPGIPDPLIWQKFLHHGFLQPRKMLNKRFDSKLLQNIGIDPQRRAQTLTLNEWLKLFESIKL